MTAERYASVFDAIAKAPAEAENMKLRARLMDMLRHRIRSEPWTQVQAAERLGVTQPRISDLMRGKISVFSLDALVEMLATSGVVLEINAKVAGSSQKEAAPARTARRPSARRKSTERAA